MARQNKTPYTILGTLTIRPMSGYDIKKFIQSTVSHFWSESYGQIYPTLKRLLRDGMVSRTTERQRGRPDRHVYRITRRGRAHLREWLQEPAESEVRRIEFLLKLFFGSEIPPAVNLEHVRRKRQEAERTLNACRASHEKVTGSDLGDAPGYPYWLLNIRAGIVFSEATIAWCDEAERTLNELTGADGRRTRASG